MFWCFTLICCLNVFFNFHYYNQINHWTNMRAKRIEQNNHVLFSRQFYNTHYVFNSCSFNYKSDYSRKNVTNSGLAFYVTTDEGHIVLGILSVEVWWLHTPGVVKSKSRIWIIFSFISVSGVQQDWYLHFVLNFVVMFFIVFISFVINQCDGSHLI